MGKAVITVNYELEKYLKQNNNYSFSRLKKNLGFDDDYVFINYLINYEYEIIKNFNYNSDPNTYKYLSKLNRYYNYSLGQVDISTEDKIGNIIVKLRLLYNLIEGKCEEYYNLPKSRLPVVANNRFNNYNFLCNNSENLIKAITKLSSKYNYTDSIYDFDKEQLVKYIVNDLKNSQYLKILLKSYPDLVYLKLSEDYYFFEDVITRYFNSLLNKNDHFEHIFYNKIIDLYLQYDKDKILKYIFNSKVNKFIMSIDSKEIDLDKEKYIYATINERVYKTKDQSDSLISGRNNKEYFEHINFDLLKPLVGEKENFVRSDFKYRYTFSMDSDEAKVLEQAISIIKKGDKYLLSIYVPDVVNSIAENKNFEKNQYQNAINNPSKSKKIFSSNNAKCQFSLDEGKECNVFAYQYLIDKDFNCYNFDFRRAVITVDKNLKMSDFKDLDVNVHDELYYNLNTLLELSFPGLEINDMDARSVNIINSVVNGFATNFIVNRCIDLNLPLIFLRTDFDLINSNIKDNKAFSNLKLKGYLNTIGNDGVYDENNFSMSLFSPLRKVSSLINQILVCIYFVNHDTEIDPFTLNYLETHIDTIADNINNIVKDNVIVNDISKEKNKVKVLGGSKNE